MAATGGDTKARDRRANAINRVVFMELSGRDDVLDYWADGKNGYRFRPVPFASRDGRVRAPRRNQGGPPREGPNRSPDAAARNIANIVIRVMVKRSTKVQEVA